MEVTPDSAPLNKKRLPTFVLVALGAAACIIIGFIAGYYYRNGLSSNTAIITTQGVPSESPELPLQAVLHAPVCIPAGRNAIRCHARVVVDNRGKPVTTTSPDAYSPAQMQKAYDLTGLSASGRIIAIVDAFDHPNIKSDLDIYSSTFGLPVLPDCTGSISSSSVPCFQKVDQRGGTSYPVVNSAWALEISLDVEIAHALCPDCKILLVEADTNTYDSLMAAIDRAVTLGADVVSNSWGSGEFSLQTTFDNHFNVTGVAFVTSSGDSGYGAQYPAASRYVTAVGGTSLYLNTDNSYKSEIAWKGAGSGCSQYESKPSWQIDKGCSRRMIADVSAVADPSTGAAIYSSVPQGSQAGWFKVGGTSLAAPIIAATYALKGVPQQVQANSLPYLNGVGNLRDVTSGSNGSCDKKFKYLCTAIIGYDGPTGLGTPNGVGAF